MLHQFRLPAGFEAFVYVSQVLQAEAIRYGVEHWRRNRNGNRCMGAVYWQLNDCWPVASWSSIEYNLHWKALHYMARRFFAPILLSVAETGDSAEFHITNDTLEVFTGEVRWSLERLDGNIVRDGAFSEEAPPLLDTMVTNLDFSDVLDDTTRRSSLLVYSLWKDGRRVHLGMTPFVPNKYLDLADPSISYEVEDIDGVIMISVLAHNTARFVMLDVPESDVRFSDNFFDLPAGRVVNVKVTNAGGLSAEEIAGRLKVLSLKDSY
jgi:beta-mannosidase